MPSSARSRVRRPLAWIFGVVLISCGSDPVERDEQLLWLVSDEARAVFGLDRTGRPLAAFDAGREDLEGIALVRDENALYLVSDELRTLFVYDYPQPFRRLPASN